MEMVATLQAKSRRYCHQQLSWFRDEKLFRWLDATQPAEEVAQDIVNRYNLPTHEGMICIRGRSHLKFLPCMSKSFQGSFRSSASRLRHVKSIRMWYMRFGGNQPRDYVTYPRGQFACMHAIWMAFLCSKTPSWCCERCLACRQWRPDWATQ